MEIQELQEHKNNINVNSVKVNVNSNSTNATWASHLFLFYIFCHGYLIYYRYGDSEARCCRISVCSAG